MDSNQHLDMGADAATVSDLPDIGSSDAVRYIGYLYSF